jgi:hypothetical protein
MRRWLSKALRNGLWFRPFTNLLTFLNNRVSLSNRLKRWLSHEGINPPGAAELYQLFWLFSLLFWLLVIDREVPWLSQPWVRGIAMAIAAYRIFEILIFALHWVFSAKDEQLHSTRRSLALFLINIIEISLLTSVILTLAGCQTGASSTWSLVYNNLAASFGLSLVQTSGPSVCSFGVHAQVIIAGMLLSIAVASLVGGVLRSEKTRSDA